ncbi:flagellar hook assembly protein FlgD [Alteromonadaceae bacterium M269]|nr:flagellar hook assembly protein FlgD [Alteromonadaceae bacterium M269]
MEVRESLLPSNLFVQEPGVEVSEGDQGNLTQADFFALLTTQLANQDPSNPADNDQLIQQVTGFSTVDGISSLNDQFESFASSLTSNQALQASSLVGRDVLVAGSDGVLDADGELRGVVVSDQTVQNLQITIENEAGEVVRTIGAGTQPAGSIEFEWDGTDQAGNAVPPGNYRVVANGNVNSEPTSLPTAIFRHVDSVNLASSSQGVVLNLQGQESIRLSDVLEIGS